MALLANYPIAVAPAMGHNFFFAYSVVVGDEGAVADRARRRSRSPASSFVLTAGIGLREHLITAIPASLKHAIAAGIGLLIAMIGLQWAGLIVGAPGTLVDAGQPAQPPGAAGAGRTGADGGADGAPGPGRVAVGHPGSTGDRPAARRRPLSGVRQPAAVVRADAAAARHRRRASRPA